MKKLVALMLVCMLSFPVVSIADKDSANDEALKKVETSANDTAKKSDAKDTSNKIETSDKKDSSEKKKMRNNRNKSPLTKMVCSKMLFTKGSKVKTGRRLQ